jgi:hypothetical protein
MYPYSRYILWRGILTLGPPVSGVSLLKEIAPSSPWNGDKLQWENARTFRSSPKKATSASLEVACDSLPLCLHRCFFRNRQPPSIFTSQSQDLKIIIIVNYIYVTMCYLAMIDVLLLCSPIDLVPIAQIEVIFSKILRCFFMRRCKGAFLEVNILTRNFTIGLWLSNFYLQTVRSSSLRV